jgi:hypothetical protein
MTEAARLSKLLFEARELIDMHGSMVAARTGVPDPWSWRVRDEIDAYRTERGWNPDGFGGESEGSEAPV